MKITKSQLSKVIQEEYAATVTTEGNLHSDGLKDAISDFIFDEVSNWHDVARASLHKEVAENGFDISDIVMDSLGGDRGGMQESKKRTKMKITKQRLSQIIKEELTYQSIGASRTIEEVFTSTNESLKQAHKDLQMLSLHLKNAGSTTEEVEALIRTVGLAAIDLTGMIADDVKKIAAENQ